jgi:murein DD-endopeptidase MepM/ murein hydrolase activator NlpD
VFVWYDDTTRTTLRAQVEVPVGDFIRQTVTIPPDKAFLIDPELERTELARLESIDGNITDERLWSIFQLPLPSTLTSPFGAFRTFNQTVETRHTGWDMRSTLGMPVMGIGAGEVAYAGWMEIRGNYVMVDHGYGVYSGYAHLSQIHVTRGQTVTAGQILGTTGNTGRTSGPHFHWEVAVNGEWVDAVRFLEMWKPG